MPVTTLVMRMKLDNNEDCDVEAEASEKGLDPPELFRVEALRTETAALAINEVPNEKVNAVGGGAKQDGDDSRLELEAGMRCVLVTFLSCREN